MRVRLLTAFAGDTLLDDTTDFRVSLAKLEGRQDALRDDLQRQEEVCERRSHEYVSRELYVSERDALRDDLRDATKQNTDLRMELAQFKKDLATSRRWFIAAVVIPLVAIVVSIFLGAWRVWPT